MQYVIYLCVFVCGFGIGALWRGVREFKKDVEVRKQIQKITDILRQYRETPTP